MKAELSVLQVLTVETYWEACVVGTYVGANKLKNLSKCTTFVQVNSTHNPVFEDLQVGE